MRKKFVYISLSALGAGAMVTMATAPNAMAGSEEARGGSIVNESTGRCLSVTKGGEVRLDDCRDSDAQTWTVANGKIRSALGQCMSIPDDTTFRLKDCASASSWTVTNRKELISLGGFLMPSFRNPDELQLGYYGGANQRWCLPK